MGKMKPGHMIPVIGDIGPGQVIHLYEQNPVLDSRERALIEAYRNLPEVQKHSALKSMSLPATGKKKEQLEITFDELADAYIEKYAKRRKKTWMSDQATIRRDLLPAFGGKYAEHIGRREISALLEKIIKRGAPISANRTLEIMSKMYNWGVSQGIVDTNPCNKMEKPSKRNKRDRVLNEDEIKTLWNGLENDDVKMLPTTSLAIKFVLVTAQRPGEASGALWSEIDKDWETSDNPTWTLPAARTKMGKSHRVPLSPIAIGILKEARKYGHRTRFVFPSYHGNGIKGVDTRTLSLSIRKNNYFNLEPFWTYDLRRTAATHMAGELCGVHRFILERVLSFSDKSTLSFYNWYLYDKEKRQALETWGQRLEQIISGLDLSTHRQSMKPLIWLPPSNEGE